MYPRYSGYFPFSLQFCLSQGRQRHRNRHSCQCGTRWQCAGMNMHKPTRNDELHRSLPTSFLEVVLSTPVVAHCPIQDSAPLHLGPPAGAPSLCRCHLCLHILLPFIAVFIHSLERPALLVISVAAPSNKLYLPLFFLIIQYIAFASVIADLAKQFALSLGPHGPIRPFAGSRFYHSPHVITLFGSVRSGCCASAEVAAWVMQDLYHQPCGTTPKTLS